MQSWFRHWFRSSYEFVEFFTFSIRYSEEFLTIHWIDNGGVFLGAFPFTLRKIFKCVWLRFTEWKRVTSSPSWNRRKTLATCFVKFSLHFALWGEIVFFLRKRERERWIKNCKIIEYLWLQNSLLICHIWSFILRWA